jgi:hypothetical protein
MFDDWETEDVYNQVDEEFKSYESKRNVTY